MSRRVSWSPDIKPVSRPNSENGQLRRQKSQIIVHIRSHGKHFKKHIAGYLTAHVRGHTRSLLLTIRNRGHRDLQLLIDQPNENIKRFYDGRQSWTVVDKSRIHIQLEFVKLGTVSWLDEKKVRKANACGFRLTFLLKKANLPVVCKTTHRSRSRRM